MTRKARFIERRFGLQKKKGAKITVLNFRKPLYSDSWNPLAEAYILHKLGKTDEAIQCVNDFVESVVEPAIQCTNDRYWGDTVKQFGGEISRKTSKNSVIKPFKHFLKHN